MQFLKIIEDNAESIGAYYKNKILGSLVLVLLVFLEIKLLLLVKVVP